MPEKQKENKIMAMLEKSGVIRRAGTDDVSSDTDASAASMRGDPNIKPIFNTPDDSIKVTPAARQPIPGMPSPVFPTDKKPDPIYDEPQEEYIEPERALAEEVDIYEYEEDTEVPEPSAAPPPPPPAPAVAPAPAPAAPQRSAPSFGGLNIFRNDTQPQEAPVAPPVALEREPQPENYTDRFLNTEELYDALALRSKKTESIYLIEEYLQTLPDSLPDAQRRDIVNKLLAASGFDYDLLMGDGVLRVKMLKEYAERFARHTDDYIAARQAELDEMDQQILRTRRLIENRKDLHKKQFFSIEAEAQRLKEILTFISG